MLAPQSFEAWLLGGDPVPYPAIGTAVQVTAVSPKMNSPHYNEPGCIAGAHRGRIGAVVAAAKMLSA